jgi:uncharacterized protein (TIGR00251 family)
VELKNIMLNKFIKKLQKNSEVYLRIKARPNASKTVIKEIMEDDTVKLDISAPPVKGKANQELIKFLAREFNVQKDEIKIISGAGDKIKLIKISLK